MRERLRRNLTGKFVGELGSRILSFAFNLVLARELGKAAFGRYSYAYAFAGMIALGGELGLNTLLTREAAHAREKAAGWLRAFAPLRYASIALVALASLVAGWALADRSRFPEIALMTAFMAANIVLDYHSAIFSAFERMGHDAGLRIATRLAVSTFGIAALLLGATLLPVLVAVTAANALSAAMGWVWRRQVGLAFGVGWDPAFMRQALVLALPNAAAWFSFTVYLYMDNLVLGALRFSDADIGQYGAAYKILDASQALPLIVIGGIFPVVAELSRAGDTRAIAPFFTRVSRLCLLLGAPLAGMAAVASPFAAQLLYGPDFAATGAALALLALAAPFFYSNLVAGFLLLALGRRWEAALFRLGASAVKLAVIIALARRYGTLSAALGTIAADALLFLFLVQWRRHCGLSEPGERRLVLKVLAGAGVAAAFWWQTRPLHFVAQAAAIAAGFFAVYAVTGIIGARPTPPAAETPGP